MSPGPPPVPGVGRHGGRRCGRQDPAGSDHGRHALTGAFSVATPPAPAARRASRVTSLGPRGRRALTPSGGGARQLRLRPPSPGGCGGYRRFSPRPPPQLLRRRKTKKPPRNSTGAPAPSCQTGPAAGGGRAARRCHWRGAGRPSPPGGGGGGGRLEAGPRGAVAPVGARRAAGSLLLFAAAAQDREPGRGRAAGPELRGELAAAPSGPPPVRARSLHGAAALSPAALLLPPPPPPRSRPGPTMAEAPQLVDIDPDFEPLPRPRSCTWPLPRPEFNPPSSATSSPAPSCGGQPEGAAGAAAGAGAAASGGLSADFISNLSLLEESEDFAPLPPAAAPPEAAACRCGDFPAPEAGCRLHPPGPPPVPPVPQPVAGLSPGPVAGQPRKSSSSRRNAWGNLSYADLITKAIESSPEKRLTLSQIYEWMVKSVPYFKDKGDSNSSAGWKVRTGWRGTPVSEGDPGRLRRGAASGWARCPPPGCSLPAAQFAALRIHGVFLVPPLKILLIFHPSEGGKKKKAFLPSPPVQRRRGRGRPPPPGSPLSASLPPCAPPALPRRKQKFTPCHGAVPGQTRRDRRHLPLPRGDRPGPGFNTRAVGGVAVGRCGGLPGPGGAVPAAVPARRGLPSGGGEGAEANRDGERAGGRTRVAEIPCV